MAENEEFQESEVIFPDTDSHRYRTLDKDADDGYIGSSKIGRLSLNSFKSEKNKKKTASSLPVNISRRGHSCAVFYYSDDSEEERWDMVAPHVISERRIDGKMAFSVCSGIGRTLKGRDLSQVRNSVLRMTGFLEPITLL